MKLRMLTSRIYGLLNSMRYGAMKELIEKCFFKYKPSSLCMIHQKIAC